MGALIRQWRTYTPKYPSRDMRYNLSLCSRSCLFQNAVNNANIRYIVLILYRHSLPPRIVMRERFRNHFNTSRHIQTCGFIRLMSRNKWLPMESSWMLEEVPVKDSYSPNIWKGRFHKIYPYFHVFVSVNGEYFWVFLQSAPEVPLTYGTNVPRTEYGTIYLRYIKCVFD